MHNSDPPSDSEYRQNKSDPEELADGIHDLQKRLALVTASFEESARTLATLVVTVKNAIDHLGRLQTDHDLVKTGLWEKTEGMEGHLTDLQESHDEAKRNQWSNAEELKRVVALWSDIQDDMTSLAAKIAETEES